LIELANLYILREFTNKKNQGEKVQTCT